MVPLKMMFTSLAAMALLCPVLATLEGETPSWPICTEVKGGFCLSNRTAVKCPQLLNGTCSDQSSVCCNITTPGPPTCPTLGMSCLFISSAIHCPQRVNATCLDALHYCCNMSRPQPEPSCSGVNGECIALESPYYCPHKVDAACANQNDYCCGTALEKRSCSDVNGACVGKTWPYFCPHKVDATCANPDEYCCGGTTSSQREVLPIVPAQPSCADVNGECIGKTWPVFCPKRANATCTNRNYYCCSLDQRQADLLASVSEPVPSCADVQGQCLSRHSRIYCAQKLDVSCESPENYCCKLD